MFQSIHSMQSLDNRIATHHQICPLPGTFHATFDEPHRKPTVTFAPLDPRSMPFWCPSTNCFARWLHSLFEPWSTSVQTHRCIFGRQPITNQNKAPNDRWSWQKILIEFENAMRRVWAGARIESNRFGLDWIGSYEIVWDRLLFVRVVRVGDGEGGNVEGYAFRITIVNKFMSTSVREPGTQTRKPCLWKY